MVTWRVGARAGETEAAGWDGLGWDEIVEGSGSGKWKWGKGKRWDWASRWRASAEISVILIGMWESCLGRARYGRWAFWMRSRVWAALIRVVMSATRWRWRRAGMAAAA